MTTSEPKDRRDFLLKLGTGAGIARIGAQAGASLRSLVPNVSYDAPTTVKLGPPNDFPGRPEVPARRAAVRVPRGQHRSTRSRRSARTSGARCAPRRCRSPETATVDGKPCG